MVNMKPQTKNTLYWGLLILVGVFFYLMNLYTPFTHDDYAYARSDNLGNTATLNVASLLLRKRTFHITYSHSAILRANKQEHFQHLQHNRISHDAPPFSQNIMQINIYSRIVCSCIVNIPVLSLSRANHAMDHRRNQLFMDNHLCFRHHILHIKSQRPT